MPVGPQEILPWKTTIQRTENFRPIEHKCRWERETEVHVSGDLEKEVPTGNTN